MNSYYMFDNLYPATKIIIGVIVVVLSIGIGVGVGFMIRKNLNQKEINDLKNQIALSSETAEKLEIAEALISTLEGQVIALQDENATLRSKVNEGCDSGFPTLPVVIGGGIGLLALLTITNRVSGGQDSISARAGAVATKAALEVGRHAYGTLAAGGRIAGGTASGLGNRVRRGFERTGLEMAKLAAEPGTSYERVQTETIR